MDDLNMVIIGIGSLLYIIPAISVIGTVGACCFIIYRNNKLEAEYINRNKLITDLELKLNDSSSDVEIELDIYKTNNEEINTVGENQNLFED